MDRKKFIVLFFSVSFLPNTFLFASFATAADTNLSLTSMELVFTNYMPVLWNTIIFSFWCL